MRIIFMNVCDIKDEKNINLIIANLVNSKINIINKDIPY